MRHSQSSPTSLRVGLRLAAVALLLCVTPSASHTSARVIKAYAARQCAGHAHGQQTQTQERESFTRTVASYEPPDVTLVDMNGASVRLASALKYDGPVLLQFIFTTCPTVCPVKGTRSCIRFSRTAASTSCRNSAASLLAFSARGCQSSIKRVRSDRGTVW